MKKNVKVVLVVSMLLSGSMQAGFLADIASDNVGDTFSEMVRGEPHEVYNGVSVRDRSSAAMNSIRSMIDSMNGKNQKVEQLKRNAKVLSNDIADVTDKTAKSVVSAAQDMAENLSEMMEDARHASERAKMKAASQYAHDLADQMREKYNIRK